MLDPSNLNLDEVALEFRQWRAQKTYIREKIPEALWKKAEALTLSHTPHQVATALKISVKYLKRRLKTPPSPSAFIEAQLPLATFSPTCQSVEFERADGYRMKLTASKEAPFDVQSLLLAFFEGPHAPNHSSH